jgi:tagaturonate reductase
MQFGEGNFLRAFIDWMIQKSNDKGLMNSNVVVVQPLEYGRVESLKEQDGLYNLLVEGIGNGETTSNVQFI